MDRYNGDGTQASTSPSLPFSMPLTPPPFHRDQATPILSVTFASSIFSAAAQQTAVRFNTSPEVMVLATSLFILGFGTGPTVWGPLSELYGRKIPLCVGFAVFTIFQIPVAVAQDLQSVLVFRFLQGFFGSSPVSVIGEFLSGGTGRGAIGAMACLSFLEYPQCLDVFVLTLLRRRLRRLLESTAERLLHAHLQQCIIRGPDHWANRKIFLTSHTTVNQPYPHSPTPQVGSLVSNAEHLGWRWTQWITLIIATFFGLLTLLVVPETYAPVLLSRRAKRLRHETGNWALHAAHEERKINLREIADKYLSRPARMFVQEPILALVTICKNLGRGCRLRARSPACLRWCLLEKHN